MPSQILVVDDEPDMESLVRQKLRQQIRGKEFEFFFSRNGKEALETLAEQPGIDLVLTDINMPVMDGLSLLGRINASGKPVTTIIVSAYGDMPNIRTAMNKGAMDFLTKPIDFGDFERTVRKGLAHVARSKKSTQTQHEMIALRHELNVAARIQQWSLPKAFPPFPERHDFELYAAMAPAKRLSGDLFDYFLLDETHLGLIIGDVNGSGIAAALFAAITRALLRAIALRGVAPVACLEHLEAALAGQQDASMPLTLFYGILDTHSGDLQFANQGHAVPILYSKTEGAKPLHDPAKPHEKYSNDTVKMKPGDGLLLYTDGVTEAPNEVREPYGTGRLKDYVNLHASGTAEQIVLNLFTAVRFFSPGTAQTDDITVMALRYRY